MRGKAKYVSKAQQKQSMVGEPDKKQKQKQKQKQGEAPSKLGVSCYWSDDNLRFNKAETTREVVHPTTMAITQKRISLAIEVVAGEKSTR
ncbi:hypothetical protein AtubIFM54640_003186 [Aspergillus tubingensis]|nr:hypothetical protein AtubIFM54640_003186 [Aspergillus tubingensis]